jgi:hypothetical protein
MVKTGKINAPVLSTVRRRLSIGTRASQPGSIHLKMMRPVSISAVDISHSFSTLTQGPFISAIHSAGIVVSRITKSHTLAASIVCA